MSRFLKGMAVLYFIGGMLHIADLFNLRLRFSEMTPAWRIWIISLAIVDLLASVGLWTQKRWGQWLFVVIAVSQLIAYNGVLTKPGSQNFLTWFHVITLAAYFFLKIKNKAVAR